MSRVDPYSVNGYIFTYFFVLSCAESLTETQWDRIKSNRVGINWIELNWIESNRMEPHKHSVTIANRICTVHTTFVASVFELFISSKLIIHCAVIQFYSAVHTVVQKVLCLEKGKNFCFPFCYSYLTLKKVFFKVRRRRRKTANAFWDFI